MPLKEEIFTDLKLDEATVKTINDAVDAHEAVLKQTYDGVANTNAEKILDGAAESFEKKTGIKRESGQKIADYITTGSLAYLETERKSYEDLKTQYDEKLKNVGDDATKKELADLQKAHDELQKLEADYKLVVDGDYKTKYEDLLSSNKSMEELNAFNEVKPAVPNTVNTFEFDAKWKAAKENIKKEYDIAIGENGKPIAISKANKHVIKPLADLVDADADLKALKAGRQQRGVNHQKGATNKVDGIPFDVPENKTEIRGAIRTYLETEKKLDFLSDEFATEFAKYNLLIKQKTAK